MSKIKQVFLITIIVCTGKFSFAQFTTTGGNITQSTTGNVGIGILTPTAPLSLLEVKNGSVLFDGTNGTTPISGAGTRMMWVPAKGAFRSGVVTSTFFDDVNVGINSFGCGFNTLASGGNSFSCGSNTKASGAYSFSSGYLTISSGNGGSFSTNTGTTSSGTASSSFGYYTKAESFSSFVIGRYNYISATYNTTSWVATDPLFVIGNGTNSASRNNALTVLKNGNVLIDKVTQVNSTYKLDVNGKIRASEIVVNTTGADFVFEKNYELMPLDVLEQKIKVDKHLPEIASAEEMQTNGVGLSELNTKLLQKTEELTLYIIELNKRIERLENKNK
jgi:hypothetical protein